MTTTRLRLLVAMALPLVVLSLLLIAKRHEGPKDGVYIAHPGAAIATDQLVVRFRDDIPDAQRDQLLESVGVTLEREMLLDGFVVVNVPEADRETIGRALAETDAVAVAEEIPARYPAAAPDDPSYPAQWHLKMIGLAKAHDVALGEGAVVAVLDTGVAFADGRKGGRDFEMAPDFADTTFVHPWDAIADDSLPFDDYGHGTHIASTIAEGTNNGLAAAGIAPQAAIMPIKVCEQPPVGEYTCYIDRIAEGIVWAVDHGAHIINLSIAGTTSISEPERVALEYAASAGVTVIAAAGNGGDDHIGDSTLEYPAAVQSVISVGAVGKASVLSYYSNYGLIEGGQEWMDMVAPGGDPPIKVGNVVINNEGPTSYTYQQTYAKCTESNQSFTSFAVAPCAGTSMAAAHVSGVAALIYSHFPGYRTPQQIRLLLHCSAEDIGTPGNDFLYGYGLVQADDALADTDGDDIPDCLDSDLNTPSPTAVPPPNDCDAPATPTPAPPTASPTTTPSPSGPTDTPSPPGSITPTASPRPTASPEPSHTESGGSTDTPTDTPPRTDTATPTDTTVVSEAPTDTPVDSPTETPTETPTATPTGTPTQTPAGTPTATASPRGIECGDVDCSGEVNGEDSLGVLRWVAQVFPLAPCLSKGYVTCDSVLNVLDAVTILRFSGQLSVSLPESC